MHIYNYSHPMTPEQLAQLSGLLGVEIKAEDVTAIAVQIDQALPLAPQIKVLMPVEDRGPSTERLWIIPPGYAPAAAILVVEMLHEYGGFVNMVRLRPVPNAAITTYEVAEIIML